MPKRGYKQGGNEINRTQRKERWINAKNAMRKYPNCAYDGDFYCDHVYSPEHPWVWVDFRFFHTKLKRYYAVAMVTVEYYEYEQDGDRALDLAYEKFPDTEDPGRFFGKGGVLNFSDLDRKRYAYSDEVKAQLLKVPRESKPLMRLEDYGPVAIGLIAHVNKPYIDEHVIREFIANFRALGEPTKPGWLHEEPAVVVTPSKLDERPNPSVHAVNIEC